MRDFYQRGYAKCLTACASTLPLITEHAVAYRSQSIFTGIDTLATIEVACKRAGYVDYGLSPQCERLYLNLIRIETAHQRRGDCDNGALAPVGHSPRADEAPVAQSGGQ